MSCFSVCPENRRKCESKRRPERVFANLEILIFAQVRVTKVGRDFLRSELSSTNPTINSHWSSHSSQCVLHPPTIRFHTNHHRTFVCPFPFGLNLSVLPSTPPFANRFSLCLCPMLVADLQMHKLSRRPGPVRAWKPTQRVH